MSRRPVNVSAGINRYTPKSNMTTHNLLVTPTWRSTGYTVYTADPRMTFSITLQLNTAELIPAQLRSVQLTQRSKRVARNPPIVCTNFHMPLRAVSFMYALCSGLVSSKSEGKIPQFGFDGTGQMWLIKASRVFPSPQSSSESRYNSDPKALYLAYWVYGEKTVPMRYHNAL